MDESHRLAKVRSLTYANTDSSLATAFGTLVSGTFIAGFIQFAQVANKDYWLGLFGSFGSLCGLLMIVGAQLGQRFSSYKNFVRPGGVTWRLMYLVWIPLPLLPISGEMKLTIMLTSAAIGSACVNMVGVTYNEWLTELTEPSSRSYYFTRRTAIIVVTGAVAGVAGGILLDAFKVHGAVGFSLLFGLAVIFAALSQFYYEKMLDLTRKVVSRESLGSSLRQIVVPLRDPKFRPVLLFSFVLLCGQSMSGNLFGAYGLEVLGLPYTLITVCGLVQAVFMLLLSAKWGGLMDRYGVRPIVALATFGIMFAPLPWLFTYPGMFGPNMIVLIIGHIVSGISWSGALPGNFNILVATAPVDSRATYLAAGQTVQALGGAVAPLVGVSLLHFLRGSMDALNAYKIVFLVSMSLRGVAILCLARVREPGARGMRVTLGSLWRKVNSR